MELRIILIYAAKGMKSFIQLTISLKQLFYKDSWKTLASPDQIQRNYSILI